MAARPPRDLLHRAVPFTLRMSELLTFTERGEDILILRNPASQPHPPRPSIFSTTKETPSSTLTMPNTSNTRYRDDLLPTYDHQGQPPNARMRQVYVQDAEDEGERYYYNPAYQGFQEYSSAAPGSEAWNWHGIEPTPMLGESMLTQEAKDIEADIDRRYPAMHPLRTVGYLGSSAQLKPCFWTRLELDNLRKVRTSRIHYVGQDTRLEHFVVYQGCARACA